MGRRARSLLCVRDLPRANLHRSVRHGGRNAQLDVRDRRLETNKFIAGSDLPDRRYRRLALYAGGSKGLASDAAEFTSGDQNVQRRGGWVDSRSPSGQAAQRGEWSTAINGDAKANSMNG